MESPVKCINGCAPEMMRLESTMIAAPNNVIGYWRCTSCWTMHQVEYINPVLINTYANPLELRALNGDDRWDYFKCSRPNDDEFTLVAKKGPFVSKERLEAFGLTVHERQDNLTLPGWRLYEVR